MTTDAATLEAHGGHAGGHTKRVRINRLGLWLFIFSDALVFALLGAARFYLNGTHTDEHIDQTLGLGITVLLLISSISAYTAETAFTHGNRTLGQRMLLVTIALGLVFMIGVGFEWTIAEFTPSEGYGTAFFSMTGMHALHVGTGVLFLAMLYAQAARGRFSADDHWPVAAVVIYWHFVDVVWVFFYPILYLVQ